MPEAARCPWASAPSLIAYHDQEWGVPVREDRHLLELLVLEGAQAGLSWRTVLERREGYRRAFAGFDPAAVAAMGDDNLPALLADPGLIRHRGKLRSVSRNARALRAVAAEHGSFAAWLWSQVPGAPRHGGWREAAEVPVTSAEADALSTALRRRGFAFAGPVTCQSLLQAAGLRQDHLVGCARYRALGGPPVGGPPVGGGAVRASLGRR